MLKVESKIYTLPLYIASFKIGKISFNTVIIKNNFSVKDDTPQIHTLDDKQSLIDKYSSYQALLILSDKQEQPTYFKHKDWAILELKKYKRYGTFLGTSPDDLLKKFSANTRKSIRVAFEKTEKKFGSHSIFLDIYTTHDTISKQYHRAFALSQQTYQAKKLDVGLPDFDNFKKRFSSDITENKVVFYILKINNIDIGYLFCLQTSQDVLITKIMGYLKEYEQYSPGTILKWLVIKNLIERKQIKFLDYNLGESQHKSRFSTDYVECYDQLIYRKSLINIAKILLYQSVYKIDSLLSEIVDNLGIKQKLRHFLYR